MVYMTTMDGKWCVAATTIVTAGASGAPEGADPRATAARDLVEARLHGPRALQAEGAGEPLTHVSWCYTRESAI